MNARKPTIASPSTATSCTECPNTTAWAPSSMTPLSFEIRQRAKWEDLAARQRRTWRSSCEDQLEEAPWRMRCAHAALLDPRRGRFRLDGGRGDGRHTGGGHLP